MALFVGVLILLGAIAFEDFAHRAVTWWLFPLLFACLFIGSSHWVVWQERLLFFSFNIGFLLLQLLLLTLYFSLKYRKLTNITTHLLGMGDVLFMLCVGTTFSLPNFIVFHVGSLLLSVLVALLFPVVRKKGIPLAGLQSIVLGVVLLVSYGLEINPFDDSWLVLLFSSEMK